ncbi:MAG: hypothetical protein ACRENE_09945 [Polyangiaceae bacterium]
MRAATPALAALVLALPARARAQDIQREPIRIAYEATAGCPDAQSFAARVIARSSHVRLAERGELARTFAVTLVEGTPSTGELTIVDGENFESPRKISAETCADVGEAMSLIVALAANPSRKVPVADPAPPPKPPRRPPPHRPPRRRRPPKRPRRSVPAPASPAVVAPAEPRPWSPPPTSLVYAGADLALAGGVTPEVLAGGSPYFGWQSLDDGPISPEFRVSALRTRATIAAGAGVTASFSWTVGRLDGCPFALSRPALRLTACARIEAGAVHVDTTGVPQPRASLTGWFAAGPLVRAQQKVLGPLFVDAELGALFRATDDTYVILPRSTVYAVPIVGLCAGAGIGALFP